MQLFIVTTQSKEEDLNGVILKVSVKTHGVYSNLTMAEGIATKFDGVVKAVDMDKEYDTRVLQEWLNPGYKADNV